MREFQQHPALFSFLVVTHKKQIFDSWQYCSWLGDMLAHWWFQPCSHSASCYWAGYMDTPCELWTKQEHRSEV